MQTLSGFKTLAYRLPVIMVGLALITATATGVIGYQVAFDGLAEAARNRLLLLASSEATQVKDRMNDVAKDAFTTANSGSTEQAITLLTQAWATGPEDQTKTRMYYAKAPSSAERARLTGADDESFYNFVHRDFHGTYFGLFDKGRYSDIFLADANGFIIYSVTKSAEFLMNSGDPAFPVPQLAQAIKFALTDGKTHFVNFDPSTPAEQRIAYLAEPLPANKSGKIPGVVVMAIPPAKALPNAGQADTHLSVYDTDGRVLLGRTMSGVMPNIENVQAPQFAETELKDRRVCAPGHSPCRNRPAHAHGSRGRTLERGPRAGLPHALRHGSGDCCHPDLCGWHCDFCGNADHTPIECAGSRPHQDCRRRC